MTKRFVVGIDLGTTNSALAYVDTAEPEESRAIRILQVPQATAAGTIESRPLLPSFLYLETEDERAKGTFRLPWGESPEGGVVGWYSRKRAAEAPERVIASAKSWLCNPHVDRTARLLPFAPDGVEPQSTDAPRRSPLEASTAYLAHLREAWNHELAGGDASLRLESQEIVLTVPASFDAAARELTVRAAADAGLADVHLLEEPQAAVYAWVEAAGDAWRKVVRLGDVLVVCDVGGGTTDLSLVKVAEDAGELVLERVAVGDHLLLGGDNMDLALAFALRERLASAGTRLDAWQFRSLVSACRDAKEKLLAEDAPESVPVVLLGRGKKLIGGTLKAELTREEATSVLVDGFFPKVSASARPVVSAQAGLAEIGLSYASDAAVTRHLAAFAHAHDAGPITHVLFNGGVMKSAALRRRVVESLASWASGAAPRVLEGADAEMAVARGAATYALARRGKGVRIRGGTARAYYVGIASAMPAVPGRPLPIKGLCVVPFGVEEGTTLDVPGADFGLLTGESASFRFFASSVRKDDRLGLVLDEWESRELEEFAPLTAQIPGEKGAARVPVRLSAHLTEIGTLELWLKEKGGERRWKLELSVRS